MIEGTVSWWQICSFLKSLCSLKCHTCLVTATSWCFMGPHVRGDCGNSYCSCAAIPYLWYFQPRISEGSHQSNVCRIVLHSSPQIDQIEYEPNTVPALFFVRYLIILFSLICHFPNLIILSRDCKLCSCKANLFHIYDSPSHSKLVYWSALLHLFTQRNSALEILVKRTHSHQTVVFCPKKLSIFTPTGIFLIIPGETIVLTQETSHRDISIRCNTPVSNWHTEGYPNAW